MVHSLPAVASHMPHFQRISRRAANSIAWSAGVVAAASGVAVTPQAAKADGPCDNVRNRVVNIRDFGASGNGKNDDTAAIQAAADCAVSLLVVDPTLHASVAVYAPAGAYLLTNRITFKRPVVARNGESLTIRGEGPTRSKFLVHNTSGGLHLNLGANAPWFKYSLFLHDLGFVATTPAAGPAIDIEPIQDTTKDKAPKIVLHGKKLSFSVAGANSYFTYGLRSTRMMTPFLDRVAFQGDAAGRASSCFVFDHAYGADVFDSVCTGAEIGIDMPYTNEGNSIVQTRIGNVGIGIKMRLDPKDYGPSASGGQIADNTIAARRRAIDIESKTDMKISGNTFSSLAGEASYQDILLTGTRNMSVVANSFVGGGANRTGVQIETGAVAWIDPGSYTTISQNIFGAMQIGVMVGAGAKRTYILENKFSGTTYPVVDQGRATYQR